MRETSSPPRVDAPARKTPASARGGVAYGVGAFLWWGLVPLYFKAVASVPALEVLSHRVLWSVVFFGALLAWRGRLGEVGVALRSRHNILTLCGSTVLIACNWLVFIWAVAHEQVLQASLGYFINPLVNVLLGFLFLRERLRPAQWLSVALSASGVAYLTVAGGTFPSIALILAASFGLYGLLRKTARVDSLVGLGIETGFLAPAAAAYMIYAGATGRAAFLSASLRIDVLLCLAGFVTAIPLLWFVNAARRLRLATVGFLQYIGPSVQFLLAVAVFAEPFSRERLISFVLVWTALVIYAIETARHSLRPAEEAVETP